jgi:hypothetical protein
MTPKALRLTVLALLLVILASLVLLRVNSFEVQSAAEATPTGRAPASSDR